jgi:hypothetical protein
MPALDVLRSLGTRELSRLGRVDMVCTRSTAAMVSTSAQDGGVRGRRVGNCYLVCTVAQVCIVVLCRLYRRHEKLWGKALSMMTRVASCAAFTMPVAVVQPLWKPQVGRIARSSGKCWCLVFKAACVLRLAGKFGSLGPGEPGEPGSVVVMTLFRSTSRGRRGSRVEGGVVCVQYRRS